MWWSSVVERDPEEPESRRRRDVRRSHCTIPVGYSLVGLSTSSFTGDGEPRPGSTPSGGRGGGGSSRCPWLKKWRTLPTIDRDRFGFALALASAPGTIWEMSDWRKVPLGESPGTGMGSGDDSVGLGRSESAPGWEDTDEQRESDAAGGESSESASGRRPPVRAFRSAFCWAMAVVMAGAMDAGCFLWRRTARDFARPLKLWPGVMLAGAPELAPPSALTLVVTFPPAPVLISATAELDTVSLAGTAKSSTPSIDAFRLDTSTLSYLLFAAVKPIAFAILIPEFERGIPIPLPCLFPMPIPPEPMAPDGTRS